MLDSFLRAVGYGLCHQLPERSLFSGGYQLPVCARDTGMYAGVVLGLIVLWLLSRGRKPSEMPSKPVVAIIAAFLLTMAIDGATSYLGLRPTTNELRLITGFLAGWAIAPLLVVMVNTQLWVHPGPGRVLSGAREVWTWLGALVLGYAAVRWLLPLTGAAYPLLLVAAIVVTFVAVNLVFVSLLPPFERTARRLRDAWPQLLIALALSAMEIAATAWLRSFVEGLA